MNVAQMHIAVQQGVDKINSLQADMLLPQEIDIELNKSMFKFVNLKYGKNNKYGTGFEESQKRIDDLRSLLREIVIPTTFKEQLLSNIWVDTSPFPIDYMYYVNSNSKILLNECNPITFDIEDDTGITYFKIPLNFLVEGKEYIDEIWMRTDPDDVTTANYLNIPLFLSADLSGQFTYPQDNEALRLWLIDPVNWPVGFEVYWQNYGNINATNKLIVIVDTQLYPQVNWDNSVTNTYTNTNKVTKLIAKQNTQMLDNTKKAKFNVIVNSGARVTTDYTDTKKVQNKYSQLDDIFTMLKDPFNTTKHTSPLFTVRQNNIDIYTNDLFIVEEIKLTYLKTPAEISLSLGADCELPDHSHREIVDMTVSSILEGITDPRYKSHELETSKNE